VQIRRKAGYILLYDRAGPYWMLGCFSSPEVWWRWRLPLGWRKTPLT